MAEKTASITIRRIDKSVKQKLRVRAAQNGRSMEEEVRVILFDVVEGKLPPKDQYSSIRSKILPLGGVDLKIPPRSTKRREPPSFD